MKTDRRNTNHRHHDTEADPRRALAGRRLSAKVDGAQNDQYTLEPTSASKGRVFQARGFGKKALAMPAIALQQIIVDMTALKHSHAAILKGQQGESADG